MNRFGESSSVDFGSKNDPVRNIGYNKNFLTQKVIFSYFLMRAMSSAILVMIRIFLENPEQHFYPHTDACNHLFFDIFTEKF